MLKNLHIAAQYLSAFAISFIDSKEDDSHTNMDWNSEKSRLSSRKSSQNLQLNLDFKTFSLVWTKDDKLVSKLELNGVKHKDILRWIDLILSDQKVEETYAYDFHYKLPYEDVHDDFNFELASKERLESIIQAFDLAKESFTRFLKEESLTSEIRVWPHHFDMGIFTELTNQLSLGIGLAVPDSVVDELYYYVSAWDSGSSIQPNTNDSLPAGKWEISDDFTGAVLPHSNANNPQDVLEFLSAVKTSFAG